MNTSSRITRRDFVAKAALATALTAVAPGLARAESPIAARFKIIAFSKPFAQLGPDETADLVAEVRQISSVLHRQLN